MPEQPDFEIMSKVPTSVDLQRDKYPQWCDLILEVDRIGKDSSRTNGARLTLTRAAGEEILDSLHETLHPYAGKSIIAELWERLDSVIDRLMSGESGEDDKGHALGLAEALAVLTNPYRPNIDAIRTEAMDRYNRVNSRPLRRVV